MKAIIHHVGAFFRQMKRRVIDRMPIVGVLTLGRYPHHKEALSELCITMLIAFAPLWLGAFALWIYSPSEPMGLSFATLLPIVNHGELFIMSASILAPVLYIVVKERPAGTRTHSKTFFLWITIALVMISSVMITLQRVSDTKITTSWVVVSTVACVLSVIVRYAALVYRNSIQILDPSALIRQSEKREVDELKDHMG